MAATMVDPERRVAVGLYRVKINGSPASKEIESAIIDLTIDERLNLPTMFELRLNSPGMALPDDGTLGVGKEVEVMAGPAGEEVSLMVGKVTTIEADLIESGPVVTIRGFDYSFALHRNRHFTAFSNQTDSDMAKKIANDAGLTPKVETTTETFPMVVQRNETDWEFLQFRAKRNGFELRVVGHDLLFRKPEPQGSPIELEWSVNMKRFQPRLSVAEQVDEVQVRAWDMVNKEAIVGKATKGTSAPQVGESRNGGVVAQEVWGKATRTIIDVPVGSAAEAETLAQAILDDITSTFISARGECNGNPKLRVGVPIKVKGVGKIFEGSYHITAAKHRFTKTSGHQTSFEASTRNPGTITSMLTSEERKPIATGVMTGVVTNNSDPDGLARVKVKMPWLSEEEESYWARLVAPEAGPDRGNMSVPEVNDEVLLAFEHGDPSRPFVLGSLWNGKDAPPVGTKVAVEGGKVNQRVIRSRSGHLLEMDDSSGGEGINIIDKTGNNHIKIVSSGNQLDVHMDGNITMVAGGSMSLTAKGDVSIESQTGTVKIKGIDIETEATASHKAKTGTSMDVTNGTTFAHTVATSADVKAGSALSLTTGGTLAVKGSGAASMELEGNLTTTVGGNSSTSVGGAMDETIGSSYALTSGSSMALKAGSSFGMEAAAGATLQAVSFETTSGTSYEVSSTSIDMVAASTLDLKAAGKLSADSVMVGITGLSEVKVTGAMIKLN